MEQPIFANKQHQLIIEGYTTYLKEFVKDVSTDLKWRSFMEVYAVIIEYHNNYGKGVREHNYWDWLMILPINLSVMTNGYLAGIENTRNKTKLHSYRILLNEMLQELIDKIEKLEPVND